MAGWVDRQVDKWIDRRIDRYVDRKLDGFLAGQMGEDDFKQLKAMTKKGEPLDADTEERLATRRESGERVGYGARGTASHRRGGFGALGHLTSPPRSTRTPLPSIV